MQLKHILWAIVPLMAAIQVAATSAATANPITTCKTGYVDWEFRPVSEIVANSHTIFLATASEFVPDNSHDGFDGYYIMYSTGTELKGGAQGPLKIYGRYPYDYPPQHYFEIRERHEEIAEAYRSFKQSGPGGISEITKMGTYCPLAPRLVLGYTYLVLIGTDSRLSFEPIHTPRNDAWFNLVRQILKSQER